jgi:hypothetical protein
MIEPPSQHRGSQEVRSQLALELALTAFAAVATAFLTRFLLRALDVGDQLWIGATTYRFTDPFARPLLSLPGAGRSIIGTATLTDLTLLALLVLFPLGLAARRRRRSRRR